ncbi:hypothetical protein [Cellvibrio sp. OA-2007]|uniref:hypothetical protein n=1 Tax=Cellvibrio sp. OA-2007 TaxID=529823 RepID=UPI000783A1FF|nr:hypothetical protein [Cellvibrio sp. OA-2007]
MNKFSIQCGLLLCTLNTLPVYAEMNRVYHPYVEQYERELEYGFTLRDFNNEKELLNRAGIGYAWNDKIFTEVYLLTESITHEGKQIRGYEAEIKWQLTEQGEYWADWGLLLEAGTAREISSHEISLGILWEKELTNRWVATANASAEYEYGSDIVDEFETALRAQLRYRYSVTIEPAIEFYLDDQDWAAGPALMGTVKLSGRKQMRWELGLLFGLDEGTPENTVRGGFEFEF